MQAAVDHQLGEMQKCFPDRRVALIAFSNEVRFMHITNINLSNRNELMVA